MRPHPPLPLPLPRQARQEEQLGLYFYNARWYDASLSRFIQADTIVPGLGNSQAWDRYAYTLNNPLRYVDPSGHRVCVDENCTVVEHSISKRSMSGRGVKYALERVRDLIKGKYDSLRNNVLKGNISGLEALAELSDFAAIFSPNCADCFVNNMASVLTGLINNKAAVEWILRKGGYYEDFNNKNNLGQSGYASIFQDPLIAVAHGGGDQAFHLWFYVQVSFSSREPLALIANIAHETMAGNVYGMSFQDFALGIEGLILGADLYYGNISPLEVGNYIRNNYSNESNSAKSWSLIYALSILKGH